MDSGGGRRRVASIPPRRKDGSGLFPDFDYATNIRATGEFYHTSAVFLALFLGDSHSLSRGFIDVIFGFDVHLETHDAKRFQRPGATLLNALETALGTARHGRRRQVETERRSATLLCAGKPQPPFIAEELYTGMLCRLQLNPQIFLNGFKR